MTKKIGLFFLTFVAILGIGVSFADVIPDNAHYVDRCVKLQNVEIDNYRVIVENDTVTSRDLYVPQAGECLKGHYKFGESRQYLVDKSVNLDEITKANIQDKAIQIGNLKVIGGYVDNSNPLADENFMYKVVRNGEDYSLEIVESEQGIELASGNRLMKFGIAWILTIIIETIVLFIIAKLFRKKDHISNGRLILIGILASTITLPLLRFFLPLFVTDEIIYMIAGELSVTLIEIFIIKYGLKVSRGKAVIASIVCNVCSYLFGLLLF